MIRNLYIFIAFWSPFFVKTCSINFPTPPQKEYFSQQINITYGKNKENTLDIFSPNSPAQNSPLVVLIHGGAWCFGEKETLHPVQEFLAKQNITSANINYRLNNGNITYKDQLKDIEKAISFLKEKSDSLKISTHKIILFGESAGAHLSLLYGYKNPEDINKIISLAAPTDFFSKNYIQRRIYHWYTKFFFERAIGTDYEDSKSLRDFKEASPIANTTNVPTLILQGTNDIIVDKSQALSLDSTLTVKKIPHKLVLIKGGIHISRRLPWLRDRIIYPEMMQFIKQKFTNKQKLIARKS